MKHLLSRIAITFGITLIAAGPAAAGKLLVLRGNGHVFQGNLAHANQVGLSFESGGGHSVTKSAVVENTLVGVFVASVVGSLTISKSSIFGNGDATANCGIHNTSATGGVVDAAQTFWGAAFGPGPNPADDVCEDPGSISVNHVATKELKVKVKAAL